MIQVFINECSFHEQLHERSVLVDSFKQFYTLLSLFNQHKVIHELYHHENLFNFYRAMHSEPLSASLNKLKEKSLALAIKGVLFNKLNAKDWQTTRIHSADDLFICMTEVVTDTCMAELAERRLHQQELIGMLLNFPQSKFAGLSLLEITKNDLPLLPLDCLDNQDTLIRWLNEQLQLDRFNYDIASSVPPMDRQTVLIDNARFRATTYVKKGRRVYLEQTTQNYWYIDSLHYGPSAHLEIFDHTGNHIGEAALDGTFIGKKDATKRLDL